MSQLNGIEQTHTYIATSRWAEGEPTVRVTTNGLLNIRPTGENGDLYMSMTVKRWRTLNAAVEAAITASEATVAS